MISRPVHEEWGGFVPERKCPAYSRKNIIETSPRIRAPRQIKIYNRTMEKERMTITIRSSISIDFFTKISLDNLDEMLYNVSL